MLVPPSIMASVIVIGAVILLLAVLLGGEAAALLRDGRDNTRYKRAAMGICPTCGYDLRGNRERCSECGTPAPTVCRRCGFRAVPATARCCPRCGWPAERVER